jgi:hypothetical protein
MPAPRSIKKMQNAATEFQMNCTLAGSESIDNFVL